MAEKDQSVLEEHLDSKIMGYLRPRVGARVKTWLSICAHCGLCADTCHYFLSSDREPGMTPANKVRHLKELLRKKGRVDRGYLQEVYQTAYYECNLCRRCTLYCPFGIDIGMLIALLRGVLTSIGMVPEGLAKSIENYRSSGNQMAVSEEEWLDTLEWCEEETAEELPGLKIPIDKKGARILYTVNAREPKFYPQDIMEVAKIFHVAGEDWTFPSKSGWDATNLAMFANDAETGRGIVENTFIRAKELGVSQVAITE